jgi:DNA polymerase type B, organellar and viral
MIYKNPPIANLVTFSKTNKSNWFHKRYNIINLLLTKTLIKNIVNKFFNEVMINFNDDTIIAVLFKLKYKNFDFKTLADMKRISKKDKKAFIVYLVNNLNVKSNKYLDSPLEGIIFSYIILPDKSTSQKKNNKIITEKIKIDTIRLFGYELPNYFFNKKNIKKYGNLISSKDNEYLISKPNTKLIYFITILDNKSNKILLKNGDEIILSFNDYLNNHENLGSFTRKIKNQEYVFIDGKLIIKKISRKTSYLKKIKNDYAINNKFITIDIETREVYSYNKDTKEKITKTIPYLICFYDGKKLQHFFLSDYKDHIEMIKDAIFHLMRKDYDKHYIYAHNLSNFDGVFLLKYLTSFENTSLKPLMKDGKIINLLLKFSKYSINFRDSLLLFPNLSLDKLSKAFDLKEFSKSCFPHSFLNNPNIALSYVGAVPDFRFFKGISLEKYNNYSKNFKNNWSIKDESIKYCYQDCIALFNILIKFNEFIFNLFKKNINKFPTLPSLAFGIFRSKYLKDKKIPLITGQMFNELKKSYTGGSTDVYIPFGENIKGYDVNSLYPTNMFENPMPVGNITYFEGDITKINSNAFGFFDVKITSPSENFNIPIIQTKVKERTISPLGKWRDFLFSEEIYNAIKYGYKFEILRGYIFDKDYIFKEYIRDLYIIKEKHNKSHPLYLISKLLLNSLYGKFGMNYDIFFESQIVFDNEEMINIINSDKYIIKDAIDLDNNKSLVSIFNIGKYKDKLIESTIDSSSNISVSIASAISSYSRIFMSNIKMKLIKDGIKIYYSDTDSLFTNKYLDKNLLGTKLGKWKLEYEFDEAVFLAPKVYGGIIKKDKTEITKVKGFKNKVSYKNLKSLLNKDKSLTLSHKKWHKNFQDSEIIIKDQIYTLILQKIKDN